MRRPFIGEDFCDPLTGLCFPIDSNTSNQEQQAKDQASGILGRLQQDNQTLNYLLNLMQQNPDVARTIGPTIVQLSQEYTDMVSKFQYVYSLLFGVPAPGLGLDDKIIVLALGLLSPIAAALYIWEQKVQNAKTQAEAQLKNAQTQAAISVQMTDAQKCLTDAQARQDTVAAQQCISTMKVLAQQSQNIASSVPKDNSNSLSTFFAGMGTAGVLALGVGALILLKS